MSQDNFDEPIQDSHILDDSRNVLIKKKAKIE